jgi:rSAM/selenodomain-associated transferase 2
MNISVAIPALNEAGHIAACVRSVTEQPGGAEVIVVDGGSTDGTPAIALPLATVICTGRGRVVQMNAGARRSSGEVLLFLHGDSALHPEALAHVRRAFEDPQIAGGTFTLRFDSNHPLLRFYAFLTRFRFRYFHFGDQGIFVRRSVFERLGGFKEIPLMEDLDFLRRLRSTGRVALIPRPVTTSARRFLERGLVRQQLLNVALVTAYAFGTRPERLVRWYNSDRVRSQPVRQTAKGSLVQSQPCRGL